MATTTPYVTFLSMILLEIFEYFEYYCEIHIVCIVALCFFVYIKVTFLCNMNFIYMAHTAHIALKISKGSFLHKLHATQRNFD